MASQDTNRNKLKAYKAAYYVKNRARLAAKNAEWTRINRERIASYKKTWKQENFKRIKAERAAWYQAHRQEIDAQTAGYRAIHREEILKNHAIYRATHKEEIAATTRAWRKAHPGSVNSYAARRRARKYNALINDFTPAQWQEMQTIYDHRCVYCKKRFKGKLTKDHITPLSQGGSHTLANIVPACRSCNSKKNAGPVLKPVQPLLL